MAGIDKCYVVEGEKGKPHTVQTDGINFHSAYFFDDLIDLDRISANDITAMREVYGVEAARSTIVDECRGVFGAYGIGVDPRHLGLISDHMTNLVRLIVLKIYVGTVAFLRLHRNLLLMHLEAFSKFNQNRDEYRRVEVGITTLPQ